MNQKKENVNGGFTRFNFLELGFVKANESYEPGYQWNDGPDAEYWQYPPIKTGDNNIDLQCEHIAKWCYRHGEIAAKMEPYWKDEEKENELKSIKMNENLEKVRLLRHRRNKGKTFDEFETPTEDLQKALETVKAFHQSRYRFLLIFGGTGTGKTHLASALAFAHKYFIIRASQLYPLIFEWKYPSMEKNYELLPEHSFGELMKIDIVIDDLGRETTDNRGHIIDGLADFIDIGYKKIVITSNLNIETLTSRYSEKIMSRILDNCLFVNIESDVDYRVKNSIFSNLKQMSLIDNGGKK